MIYTSLHSIVLVESAKAQLTIVVQGADAPFTTRGYFVNDVRFETYENAHAYMLTLEKE